jgi:hypothetical protein
MREQAAALRLHGAAGMRSKFYRAKPRVLPDRFRPALADNALQRSWFFLSASPPDCAVRRSSPLVSLPGRTAHFFLRLKAATRWSSDHGASDAASPGRAGSKLGFLPDVVTRVQAAH